MMGFAECGKRCLKSMVSPLSYCCQYFLIMNKKFHRVNTLKKNVNYENVTFMNEHNCT